VRVEFVHVDVRNGKGESLVQGSAPLAVLPSLSGEQTIANIRGQGDHEDVDL
jgi:hypothetical protein